MEVIPVGDAAVMAILGDSVNESSVQRAWHTAQTARQILGKSALDVVPAYASVLVRFDPAHVELACVMACLRAAAVHEGVAQAVRSHRLRVGVCFGGDYGADLDATAAALDFSPQRFIDVFCAAEYRVAFIGFLAGFPYLIGLPPELAAPRLAAPRDRVPAGSVAIAGEQCGIYPRSSPGGWRLLGTTRAEVFNHLRVPPALFAPGDRVRFERVERLADARAEIES